MGIRIKNITAMVEENGLFTTKVCDLYLEGDTIAAIDTPPEGFTAHRTIDGTGRMAIPGLINAHTHAYMTVFRNVADDLPFHEWLMGTIDPLEARLTPEDGYWGAMLGCMEMLRTGTTCFVDMHMFEGQSVRAAADSGMRAVISRGLQGGDSDPAGGARRIREALAEFVFGTAELEDVFTCVGALIPPRKGGPAAYADPATLPEGLLERCLEKLEEQGERRSLAARRGFAGYLAQAVRKD